MNTMADLRDVHAGEPLREAMRIAGERVGRDA